jgi:hypothetical protein
VGLNIRRFNARWQVGIECNDATEPAPKMGAARSRVASDASNQFAIFDCFDVAQAFHQWVSTGKS